ncbi:MAG TPA: aminoacyl-tRNA deacylase, partial [Burkholderiaceae bacterium]|nr:aminoacyl-tRNA deacylase [Burkholderiaceae bacterium]
SKNRNRSATPATRWLDQHRIPYSVHHYDYAHQGGARQAAAELETDLHHVAKTLVMEDEHGNPLVIIMHGDLEVSTRELARQTGAKKIVPCAPAMAERHTGYKVGGTSPFGTRKRMPLWVEADLLELEKIFINGGRRGLLLGIAPAVLVDPLGAQPVQVGRPA